MTIPCWGAAAPRAIGEVLALTPWTKLLAGSDGQSYPEMHWRGARLWRAALVDVLAAEVVADRADVPEAGTMATAILGGNARRLFGVRGEAT